jgi:hypothetical protein
MRNKSFGGKDCPSIHSHSAPRPAFSHACEAVTGVGQIPRLNLIMECSRNRCGMKILKVNCKIWLRLFTEIPSVMNDDSVL